MNNCIEYPVKIPLKKSIVDKINSFLDKYGITLNDCKTLQIHKVTDTWYSFRIKNELKDKFEGILSDVVIYYWLKENEITNSKANDILEKHLVNAKQYLEGLKHGT